MNETIKNILKNGAAMFAVGALLAVSSPFLASAFGVDASIAGNHDPFWTGIFFGAFGAIHAAVAPVMDWVTGDAKGKAIAEPGKEIAPQVSVSIAQTPVIVQEKSASHFCDCITAERTKPVEVQIIRT